MALHISLNNIARQNLLVTLGDQQVALTVQWAPQPAHWYLSASVEGRSLAAGRQITTRTRLLRLPDFIGDLYCRGPHPESGPPPRNGWTEGWGLYYLHPSEDSAAGTWI